MVADVFSIKRDSLRPSIRQILQDEDGVPIPLAGATVRCRMARAGDTVRVNAPATIVDVALGRVRYDWVLGDTALAGTFMLEWLITYSDTTPEIVPSNGYTTVIITPDLV